MGYGDKLMAIGDAWVQHQADPERRKVAIGDGVTVDCRDQDLLWGLDHFIANQQEADAGDVTWVHSYPSGRPYIDYEAMRKEASLRGMEIDKVKKLVSRLGRYIWKDGYHANPAPIQLMPEEDAIARKWREMRPFVIIEPFIKLRAPPSKQYPVRNFLKIATELSKEVPVFQIGAPGSRSLSGLRQIRPRSFRQSMAFLKAASLYIGPEGGLHHAAAAMGTPAVVIFGGFISPKTTGYDFHVNLTGTAEKACGTRYGMCPHCARAFNHITPDLVLMHARKILEAGDG